MKKRLLASLSMLFISFLLHAQQKDSVSQLVNLSLEKLMDIPIYSASKNEETTFEAPLSSSVITKEQIRNAGSTTIMEALRLLPGVIVREQTNGNYDIHVLGLDNVPPNSSLIFFANSTTLIMVDNRPVYNYLHGGTFWETLPITLNDVERIELVRGPCAAMYGPNAVSGVINIITRSAVNDGLYAVGDVAYGSYNSLITQASLGYKINNKLSAWLSGNFQRRDRTQSTYYDVVPDQYVLLDSVTAVKNALKTDPSIINNSYPDPGLSMRKHGYNVFVNYDPKDRIHLALAAGGQKSQVQNEFGSGLAYINTATSTSNYADLRAYVYDFDIQISHLSGTEAPVLGQKIWQWDLSTTDVVAEYKYDKIKNLIITPGITYRLAVYDDSKYIDITRNEGFWSGQAKSETKAASVRIDYRVLQNKLRLMAAGRLDKFNYPSKTYFSYELAATYKLNENNLIRISEGRANRTPLLIDIYSNLNLTGLLPLTSASQTYLLQVRGNKNIRLLTSDMLNVGYRSKIHDNLALDIELFDIRTHDFSNVIFESGSFDSTAAVVFTGSLVFDNIAVRAEQYGGTITVDYSYGKWQIKPFITIQQTKLFDYSPYNNSPNTPPLASNNYDPGTYNVNSGKGQKISHQATPAWFGGFVINWAASQKLNFNVNAYFFGPNTELESGNLTYHSGTRGIQDVNAKILLNGVVSYKFTERFSAFGNFRNILNDRSVEFFKGDAPAFMAYGGINFEF